MPRQSRGRPAAPSRPTAAPARPSVPAAQPHPTQNRTASTVAHPPAQQAPPAPVQQSQGPGLFGQMASTAAGVAVGSSIGHAIGGLFSGGSSSAAPQEATQQAVANGDARAAYSQSYNPPRVCENQVMQFRNCMDTNQGDLNICGWYLEQLKACQQAASQY
ncbi:uncharacterized protein PV09_01730 [Verruconis gallopava]|uniref:CHCH domain-containing protein n=1 Tax=Verruconis gallopava TaxID=253628 RepID=A0A0D2B982_9PEZI|nr:uncharacterized protein PV09_01730 [Verruconis gallopava]KIW07809.1 hypothetical protein PV09_01730 [Verruconis gallopava]